MNIFLHILEHVLHKAQNGSLTLENEFLPVDHRKRILSYGSQKNSTKIQAAYIQIKNKNFYRKVVLRNDIGLGEAYFSRYWDSPNILSVLNWFMCNGKYFLSSGRSVLTLAYWPVLQIFRVMHFIRRNTIKNSRKNIADHYDLSNQFYQLWLSKEMAYSCAYYEYPEQKLHEAQIKKFRMIADKLQLKKTDHLLEIGCGWGGFTIFAAQEYGCRVTAVTVSQAQYDYCDKLIQKLHLTDQVSLLLKDYRNLIGNYDKIVSIEMMEALGFHYYDNFFRQCTNLLKDDGLIVLQCITFPDCYFENYIKSYDYIQKYIFPGSSLLSMRFMLTSIAKTGTLYLHHLETLGNHYANTLDAWSKNFIATSEKIRSLGFNDKFIKKWLFYFAYCQVGFANNYINDVQITLSKIQNTTLNGYKDLYI